MKTAMQELLERVREYRDLETSLIAISRLNSVYVDILGMLEKEKEVAQQYAEFAIECDRKELPVLEFDGWINLKHHRVTPTPLCETKQLKNNE